MVQNQTSNESQGMRVCERASIVACGGMYVHTADENSDGRCGQWNDERRASTQRVDDSTYTLPNDRLLNI